MRLGDPLFVATGGVGRAPISEAAVMGSLLQRLGVEPGRILLEETGTDTLSSVRAVRALLRRRGHAGEVFAATSGYHLPRCVLLLRLAGLPARACPPPPQPAARRRLVRYYWWLREVPAVPYDAALLLLLRLTGRV